MFIKKNKIKHSDGSVWTQVRIVESFRPFPGAKSKQRTIRDCGYLENQSDPDQFLKNLEEEINQENEEKRVPPIVIDTSRKINDPSNRDLMFGPVIVDSITQELRIPQTIRNIRSSKATYDLASILRYLVALRIVDPDSKRSNFMDSRHTYGMNVEFTLPQIYRSLDELCKHREEIQDYLHKWIDSKLPCDTSFVYLDVTNFYFETDYPKNDTALGQRGVSKEHRTDPIVQMGCVLNANAFPIAHECFKGNTSDGAILKPMVEAVLRRKRMPDRIIVVADKGLNDSKNTDYLLNHGHGYLFSQPLKGTRGKRYQEKMFDENGYIYNSDGTYKWKLFEEEYFGKDNDGKKIKRRRKVLIYWTKANAERDKAKRDAKVMRAKKSIKGASLGGDHSKERYIRKTPVDKETGEELDADFIAAIDEDKIESESRFDGYNCLITSEMEYDERKMREVYHNLWLIESTFKVEKSDLNARPIYVQTDNHIRGHFVTCHIAMFIMRLIQWSMGADVISAERIQRVLQNCILDIPTSGVLHFHEVSGKIEFRNKIDEDGYRAYSLKTTDDDEVAIDFELFKKAVGLKLDMAYERQEVFNKKLKNMALALHPRK